MPDSPISAQAYQAVARLRREHGADALDEARLAMWHADARGAGEAATRLWAEICFLLICHERLGTGLDRA